MGDTFSLIMIIQVDNYHKLSDKVELENPIGLRPRAQSDGKANKCSGNLELTTLEMNNSTILNFPDDVAGSIFNRWQRLWEGSVADPKAKCRNVQIQSFMRTMMVVFETPFIKLSLSLIDSPGNRFAQQFSFQCSVKSFIFSKSFWMRWRAVANQNAKPHQPNSQLAKWISTLVAPRWTVVRNDLVRQTILTKRSDQMRLHSRSAFIQTCFQNHRVSRMIIQHRQRMAPPFRASNMSFKIHLPKIVRMLTFKSLKRRSFQTFNFIDKSMPSKYFCDRTWNWNFTHATVLQKSSDFSATPGSMPFPHPKDCFFHNTTGPIRAMNRPARKVFQTFISAFFKTLDPFIASLAADPKIFAKLTYVFIIFCQINKFLSKMYHTYLFPRHRCLPPDRSIIAP